MVQGTGLPEPEEGWVAFAETLPARLQRLLDGCARLLGDGDDGAIDGDTSFIFADFLDEKLRAFFDVRMDDKSELRPGNWLQAKHGNEKFAWDAARPVAAWALLGALVRHGGDAVGREVRTLCLRAVGRGPAADVGGKPEPPDPRNSDEEEFRRVIYNEELAVDHFEYEPVLRRRVLLGLPAAFTGLRALWLCGVAVDDDILRAIGGGLPQLGLLSLGGCDGLTDASLGALLRALPQETSHSSREAAAHPASPSRVLVSEGRRRTDAAASFTGAALTHLDVRGSLIGDESLDAIADFLPGLVDLCAFGCRRLTDRGLAALSGLTCENLRKLNTVGAYKCTDAALQCLLQSHPTILLYHKPEKFGEGFTE